MTDDEIRTEIANQVRAALTNAVASLRAKADGPGSPPSAIILRRVAEAIENSVGGK